MYPYLSLAFSISLYYAWGLEWSEILAEHRNGLWNPPAYVLIAIVDRSKLAFLFLQFIVVAMLFFTNKMEIVGYFWKTINVFLI